MVKQNLISGKKKFYPGAWAPGKPNVVSSLLVVTKHSLHSKTNESTRTSSQLQFKQLSSIYNSLNRNKITAFMQISMEIQAEYLANNADMFFSCHSKNGASLMSPYLTTSAMPEASSLSGKVFSVSVSISTH